MAYSTVRVWVSRAKLKSPGHASLEIYPHSDKPSNGYVSFAPATPGQVPGPGRFYPRDYDLQLYGKTANDDARGYWIGRLAGLDQNEMMRRFADDQVTAQVYSVYNVCSTQVHKYLQIGGGDKFASLWSRTALLVWSPDDVEDYAKSIVANTLGSSGLKVEGAGSLF